MSVETSRTWRDRRRNRGTRGVIAPPQGALATVPASAFPSGLTATYYNNTTLTGTAAATGTVPNVALSPGGKSPAPGVNASGWSVKLTGNVKLPAAGSYALSLSFTGTASVTINGTSVFASSTGFGGVSRATVTLPAGTATIEMDYADTIPFGSDGVTLGWQPPANLFAQAVAAAKKASFAFSHLSVRHGGGGYRVSADVTNTGARTGAEVAQLYVGDPSSTGEPVEQLKGFQRVTLWPGQTTRVSFTVPKSDFAWWNGHWEVTPGSYALMVGDSSASLPLAAHVEVNG